jgi:CheY-like chemotaxis protein
LATSDSNQARVLFSVTDTGIGIADEKIEQLFQPFSQVSTGYRRDYQGAGLGLSICKKLIELMGGTIAIESEPGKGTTVHFCITFSVDEPIFSQQVSYPITGKSNQLRILLAEDEEVNRLATSKLLEKLGHTVKTAKDGQEAIALLKDDSFDVILMDIQMPVMDGVEATKSIRGGDAGQGNKDIPIIAMTAYAMSGDKENFLAAGMDSYISKPVDMKQLDALLQDKIQNTE